MVVTLCQKERKENYAGATKRKNARAESLLWARTFSFN
jgi:hypothetical protein|tara:strand:- start:380 stop:493 length:114 start_codon:yes stop_codon:yes gene_type:complete